MFHTRIISSSHYKPRKYCPVPNEINNDILVSGEDQCLTITLAIFFINNDYHRSFQCVKLHSCQSFVNSTINFDLFTENCVFNANWRCRGWYVNLCGLCIVCNYQKSMNIRLREWEYFYCYMYTTQRECNCIIVL